MKCESWTLSSVMCTAGDFKGNHVTENRMYSLHIFCNHSHHSTQRTLVKVNSDHRVAKCNTHFSVRLEIDLSAVFEPADILSSWHFFFPSSRGHPLFLFSSYLSDCFLSSTFLCSLSSWPLEAPGLSPQALLFTTCTPSLHPPLQSPALQSISAALTFTHCRQEPWVFLGFM